jgi:hypothetical protein
MPRQEGRMGNPHGQWWPHEQPELFRWAVLIAFTGIALTYVFVDASKAVARELMRADACRFLRCRAEASDQRAIRLLCVCVLYAVWNVMDQYSFLYCI